MTDTTSVADLLNGLVDAFNSHDIDRVMSYFADNCVLQMPRGPSPDGLRAEGFANVKAALNTRFEGIPDVHYGNDSHYVYGNVGISKWLLMRNTTAGQGLQLCPPHQP